MANGPQPLDFNPIFQMMQGRRQERMQQNQLQQQQQQFEAQEPLRRARQRLIEGQAKRIEASLENVLDPQMVKSAVQTFQLPEESSPLLRGATREFALEMGRVANRARTLNLAASGEDQAMFTDEMSEIRKELDTAVQQFNQSQQALADIQSTNTDEMIEQNPNLRAQRDLALQNMRQAQSRISQNRQRIDQLLSTQLKKKGFQFQDQPQGDSGQAQQVIETIRQLQKVLKQTGQAAAGTTQRDQPSAQDVVDQQQNRSPQGQF